MKTNYAQLTGISILIMALAAGFSYGYIFQNIYTPDNIEETGKRLIEQNSIFKWGIIGWIVIIICDLIVSIGLANLFSNSKAEWLKIGGLRILYTSFLICAVFFLIVASPENSSELIYKNLSTFEQIWSIGLIIFGFHLYYLGKITCKTKRLPMLLSGLLLIAGISYIMIHSLKNIKIPFSMELIEMTLAIPMTIAEIGLAIWLIVKGKKLALAK